MWILLIMCIRLTSVNNVTSGVNTAIGNAGSDIGESGSNIVTNGTEFLKTFKRWKKFIRKFWQEHNEWLIDVHKISRLKIRIILFIYIKIHINKKIEKFCEKMRILVAGRLKACYHKIFDYKALPL